MLAIEVSIESIIELKLAFLHQISSCYIWRYSEYCFLVFSFCGSENRYRSGPNFNEISAIFH
jgi:hypothetical protein